MSSELHVFFAGSMPSRQALQRSLRELDWPVRLDSKSGKLSEHAGFPPAFLTRPESGVEWDVTIGTDAIEGYGPVGRDLDATHRVDLRWSGDLGDAAVAAALAAALAHGRQAIVFDDDAGAVLSAAGSRNVLSEAGEMTIFDERVGSGGVRYPLSAQAASPFAVPAFTPDAGPLLADHAMRLLTAAGHRVD